MGFYIRKYINLGIGRVNISKSGLGLSAGRPGLRVGIDSKGKKYIHVGRKGLYYRKTLERATANPDVPNQNQSNLASLVLAIAVCVFIFIVILLAIS